MMMSHLINFSEIDCYTDFVKQFDLLNLNKLERVTFYLLRAFIIKTWLTDPNVNLFSISNKDLFTIRERRAIGNNLYRYQKTPICEVAECIDDMYDFNIFKSCEYNHTGVHFSLVDEFLELVRNEFELFKKLMEPSTKKAFPLSLIKVTIYYMGLSILQNINVKPNEGIFIPKISYQVDVGMELKLFNERRDLLIKYQVISVNRIYRSKNPKKTLKKDLFYHFEYNMQFKNFFLLL